MPNPVNEPALVGLLVASRPQAIECLADPANRGPEKETVVKVTATVTESGAQYTATGANLAEPGAQCIQQALQKLAKVEPLAKGGAPVTAEIEIHHATGGTMPGVVMGNNEASDIVGKLRLATGQWCDCFADWKTAPPEELFAEVTVTKAKPNLDLAFVAPTTPAGQKVAACLEPKMEALQHQVTAETVKVPKYGVLLLNSNEVEPPVNAEPQIEFLQLESARTQATADSAIGVGNQVAALTLYASLADQYKKAGSNWKVTDALLPKIVTACESMHKADAALTQAFQRQLQIEQRMATRTAEFAAQDERWAPAAEETKNQVPATEADLAKHQESIKGRPACPKAPKRK
jgi:hypothetical protein